VRDGRIKALVVTGAERSKVLPSVPTLAEDGAVDALKNYGTYSIYGLLGPAGMPQALTMKLNEELGKISAMPDVMQRLEAANLRAATSSPAELKRYIEREVAKWKEVGKKLKLD
jgi:tripartite-type tricarboxylate transporter receptor subunit TctC